jgi:hypothetical protein
LEASLTTLSAGGLVIAPVMTGDMVMTSSARNKLGPTDVKASPISLQDKTLPIILCNKLWSKAEGVFISGFVFRVLKEV